jgi:transcriptional regulator with XRE-family HTH domain
LRTFDKESSTSSIDLIKSHIYSCYQTDKLRELRKRQGLSQEALAYEAGLERNYISLLELGRNSASVKTIFKLAPALGISVTALMGMVESKASLTQSS